MKKRYYRFDNVYFVDFRPVRPVRENRFKLAAAGVMPATAAVILFLQQLLEKT